MGRAGRSLPKNAFEAGLLISLRKNVTYDDIAPNPLIFQGGHYDTGLPLRCTSDQ